VDFFELRCNDVAYLLEKDHVAPVVVAGGPMKRISLLPFCFVCLFGFSADAANDAQPEANPKETFLVPPFPAQTAWKKITDTRSEQQTLVEWIPSEQSPDDVRDILTEQIFFTLKDQSASDFIGGFFQRTKDACTSVRVNGPTAQIENGYKVAYGQVYCVGQKNADKDVDIFIKAIAGKEALYVAQREFRRPAKQGAPPGLQEFPKGSGAEALVALQAKSAANHFLVSQVKLCADVSDGGCAPGPSAQTDSSDVSASFGLEPGKSTRDNVEDKFGRPTSRNQGPDGRHADMYVGLKGLIVSFLFDKNDVLIRTAAYSHQ
jgi:hypothetical protein